MANEINIQYTAGRTLQAQLYLPGWTAQGGAISMTEDSSGLYSGDVPGGTPANDDYIVLITDTGFGVVVGQGELNWDGTAEVTPDIDSAKLNELWQLRGLDPANATTFRTDKIFVGPEVSPELEVTLTGDGVNETVSTRVP